LFKEIREIVQRNIVGGNTYNGIMFHSINALKNFKNITLYHIKWHFNVEVDKYANVGSRLTKGTMVITGELRIHHLH
jgi:hypothetical protein